ncbi:hypothetical protein CVT24_004404 [Panaeolus cyanescens]|uniref:Uncharacterized protein n=1 Tax=Panaeolus cyanescens TaxID=181874 RepID=A0A409YBJ7_9AGAR|nr:hypothetical protein CVT24_004404 [Panaeolus cyanescens]
MSVRSPFAGIFLLHIALEIPVAVQGIISPENLPFLQLNNTAVVLLKVCNPFIQAYRLLRYGMQQLRSCIVALLCFPLPGTSHFPTSYPANEHWQSACASTTPSVPRFCTKRQDSYLTHSAPLSNRASFSQSLGRSMKITPENLWGTLHGFVGLGMVVWWQATVQLTAMARQAQRG